MPKFHSQSASLSSANLDAFTAGYIMALFWTSTGDGDQPDSEIELSPESLADIVADCAAFQTTNAGILAEAYARDGYGGESQAGHDYWLTRNHHGAGFWDRDALEDGDLGERLSELARAEGEVDAYEGDDGLLYTA